MISIAAFAKKQPEQRPKQSRPFTLPTIKVDVDGSGGSRLGLESVFQRPSTHRKRSATSDLSSPKKKLPRPSKDDCRGTVFSERCEGTKMNQETYWCPVCDKTKDENRFLEVDRIVLATEDNFVNKNKQFLHSNRCKRLLIATDVHYVLETAEQAKKVVEMGGCVPLPGKGL
eukprot:TRINITY_DN4116_c0_g1_i1.p1 TRINITY_DN4116_c0_g1~~TRINITY_DN4116_c0_g1_i1.p1  ORF type:complete len:172 (+),score=25.83 TRINITY_DN4116_c0_g1_i1:182-697(+)